MIGRKNNYIKAAIILFFIFATALISFAEEIEEPIECNGDEIEYFEKERKVVGSGNIVIKYKDTTLSCDKVTVWTDTKEAEAEGNVKIVQGDNLFTGETITYNFEEETGTVVKFKGHTPPWYARGEKAERTGPDEFVVHRGYITTCGHEHPHYRISARKILIYPEVKVVAKDATLWAGPVPVLWIPVYAHPLDEDRPRVTVIPGKNSEWGNYLLTAWRYNLDPKHKGYVHIDYRERRDLGYGFDHVYDTNIIGKGMLKTYYIHERDLGREHIYDSRDEGGPTKEEEKFLVQWRHKWQIWDDTIATTELYKYRDKDFRKDYFYNDYEKDETPRSYLLLTKTQPLYSLSVLTEKRANRFEDLVERLPEVELDMHNNRIGNSRFYYKGEFSAVNLNRKFPRSTDESPVGDIPVHHNNRFDAYNKLSYAGKAAWLNVTPYAAVRQTYYSRGLNSDDFDSDSHLRGIFYTGVDVSTKFYRVFDTQASALGMEINNLRHIITPSVSYGYNPHPTLDKNNIYQFDSIDEIDRNNAVKLLLENKLQTKRGKSMGTVELARLGVSTTYDFKHTAGAQFLDYETELELRPYDWLTITSDTIIDPHERSHHEWLKQINTDIVATIKDFSLGVSHSYIEESNNIVGQVEWRINPKWKIKAYENFDFKRLSQGEKKTYELREQRYTITRDLHCWEMGVHYNVFREKGEEILVVFRLKAFPGLPFEFGKNYHEPKMGSQGYRVPE